MTELALVDVPPPLPAWRRVLSQVQHFWLLIAFLVVWQCVSVFGLRFNPQLDVMLPPPTAVFSAAVDLMGRGVLVNAHARQLGSASCLR
jgi:ABC-type nitrate/sulfonate/bicarbonate transport system permease component